MCHIPSLVANCDWYVQSIHIQWVISWSRITSSMCRHTGTLSRHVPFNILQVTVNEVCNVSQIRVMHTWTYRRPTAFPRLIVLLCLCISHHPKLNLESHKLVNIIHSYWYTRGDLANCKLGPLICSYRTPKPHPQGSFPRAHGRDQDNFQALFGMLRSWTYPNGLFGYNGSVIRAWIQYTDSAYSKRVFYFNVAASPGNIKGAYMRTVNQDTVNPDITRNLILTFLNKSTINGYWLVNF